MSKVPFIAFDIDPKRVAQGRAAGHRVVYGDISDPELLAAAQPQQADLVLITVDHTDTVLRAISLLRTLCPQTPIITRARDLDASSRLLAAGALHAYPEAIESSLRLGAIALQMLHVPTKDVDLLLEGVRDWNYQPVIEEKQDQ